MSRGYSSAMSVNRSRPADLALLLLWLSLMASWTVLQRRVRLLLALVVLAPPLFMAWKHAIVRYDVHAVIIAKFGLFVLVVLLAEATAARGFARAVPAIVVLVAPLMILWALTFHRYPEWKQPTIPEALFGFRGARDLIHATALPGYRTEMARSSDVALLKDRLPAAMVRAISRGTVDVYPWDATYVAANGLQWQHRPVPASFGVYTARLDEMNERFFRSPRRPAFLIWHRSSANDDDLLSIDGRHLFWDEPRTLRAILDSYDVAGFDDGVILLRSGEWARFGPLQPLSIVRVGWNEWTPVPRGEGIVLAAASIEGSRAMRLMWTIFRADPVFVTVRLHSGEEREYRVVPETMRGGLWISPLPMNLADLVRFFEDRSAPTVAAVRFSTRGLTRVVASSVSIQWYTLTARPERAGQH
jgi:hypothetical protein